MASPVKTALNELETSIAELETKLVPKIDRATRDQAELFGISEEEKTLNRTIATKLDSTIERLETILQEEQNG
tara:strand:- start:1353 stop:1571 length:219 start_codon:yes stop_codon:yes gene_type:complete